MENLDSLVMIYKNWRNDARVGCNLANEEDVTKSFTTEVDLLESHEAGVSQFSIFQFHFRAKFRQ